MTLKIQKILQSQESEPKWRWYQRSSWLEGNSQWF